MKSANFENLKTKTENTFFCEGCNCELPVHYLRSLIVGEVKEIKCIDCIREEIPDLLENDPEFNVCTL